MELITTPNLDAPDDFYEALLAAAKAKGGPTVYTKATVPDWDGYYSRDTQADRR